MRWHNWFGFVALLLPVSMTRADMERVRVADDSKGFVLSPSGKRFVPWGFNYDHDEKGRLLEDYWETDWPKIENDFREMKQLGANVVRVHLQLGKFMLSADRPNSKSLDRLEALLRLAEKTDLYLNLTGLGCYHKKDVPAWYDEQSETQRWKTHVVFWQAIAQRSKNCPAVFCYDLMNEPVVPGGKRPPRNWLGPDFAGKHFVQFITLDQDKRSRPDIAAQWVETLCEAIRAVDTTHLITVGLVPWSLDRPGLTSGFVPEKIAKRLDFVSVHLYPKKNKIDEELQLLRGFAVGKPVVVEEIFPLNCSPQDLDLFVDRASPVVSGWIGFYWGQTQEDLRPAKSIPDAMLLGWLDFFQKKGPSVRKP